MRIIFLLIVAYYIWRLVDEAPTPRPAASHSLKHNHGLETYHPLNRRIPDYMYVANQNNNRVELTDMVWVGWSENGDNLEQ